MKLLKFLSFAVLAMCFAANLTASVGVIVLDEDGIVISTSSNGGSYDDSVNSSVKSYKNSSDSEDWDANAKGEMSASQWARYMKITNKMASAASQM